jgi:membrane protein DedA with SNARE-associated domain
VAAVHLGIFEFFSGLTYSVSIHNPLSLGLIFLIGIMTDVGFPLLLTLEVFLLLASYSVGPLSTPVLLIISMLLLGRESGAAILYWLSYFLGEPFLRRLERYFPWLIKRIPRLKPIIRRRTTLMVVAIRLTPGFLQLPALLTGSFHLSYVRFVLGVPIASLIYDIGLVLFGFVGSIFFKNAPRSLQDYFLISLIVFVVIMWLVLFFRFRNIFNQRNGKE